MGSRISGTCVAGRTCGKSHNTRLRKIFMGIRISGPGGAGQTSVQAHRTRLMQRFLVSRIYGTGVAGQTSRTSLRQIFSGGITQPDYDLPVRFGMSTRSSL